jgi:lactoylglutathione lyase family protein
MHTPSEHNNLPEQTMTPTYPRTFSHIGISVPDIEGAVKFYTQVLGWYLIMQPTEIKQDNSAIGDMCTDVFGENWQSFKIAHLSTGDRIGVELFQFKNQTTPENNFEYWKTGVFHFCVQDPDVEGLAQKIVDAGGKRRMVKPRFYYPGEKPYRMIYMEDPFGNILEIYSHSYELHYASAAYA